MMKPLLLVASTLLLSSFAEAQYFDARNNAMGGVGVASSHYLTAGFANPALLTRFRKDDHFGVMIPHVGLTLADKDGLVSDLDEFVDEVDAVQAKFDNLTITAGDLVNLNNSLQAMNGKSANGNLGAGFAIAMPAEGFAWSIHAHTYADLNVLAQVDPADTGRITSATNAAALDSLGSEIRILGVSITELGFSMAREFQLGGMALSIGVTPKFQRVDTINYSVNVTTYEDDDFDADQYTNDDTGFNVDFGAALELIDSVTIGLMVRNLVAEEYLTTTTFGQQFTYEVTPQATLGAAWSNQTLTVAADIDITEVERYKDGSLKFGTVLDDNSRFVRAGFELNGWDWVQLRGGIQTDLEDTVDDVYSAGLGFSPANVWHLDIAATYSGEDSYGGVVQMGFTF